MSAYVKKIQFKLHESYVNPLRGEKTLMSVKKVSCIRRARLCSASFTTMSMKHQFALFCALIKAVQMCTWWMRAV